MGRKTCPTNRGLRPREVLAKLTIPPSEDLPHKSGITTLLLCSHHLNCQSEDLPHKSGITTCSLTIDLHLFVVGRLAPQIGDYDSEACIIQQAQHSRKTCPTNRGLRPITVSNVSFGLSRKTCPTNRGLRQPKSRSCGCIWVGRLAPQIGDYDVDQGIDFTNIGVGRLAPQIGDYDDYL